MSWEIKAGEANVWQRLTFDKLTGGGKNSPYEYVHVSVTYDFDDPGMEHLTDFGGYFYIEFENGDRIQFYAIQKGVLSKLDRYANMYVASAPVMVTDGRTYYYEIVQLGPGVWLDRYIGAHTAVPSATGSTHVASDNMYGKSIMGVDLTTVCPKGFRIPKYGNTTDESALKYIWDNAVLINTSSKDNVDGNTHTGYTNRWAIRTSTNPEIEYYYPNSGAMKYGTVANNQTSTLVWLFSNAAGTHYGGMFLGISTSNNAMISSAYVAIINLNSANSSTHVNKFITGTGYATNGQTWSFNYEPVEYQYRHSYFTTRSHYTSLSHNFYYVTSSDQFYSPAPARCIRDLP